MSHRPVSIAGLVDIAAEAVRTAIHRTLIPGRLPAPGVSTVLGELSVLTHRLPQLCCQLAANLEHRHHLGGLRLDLAGQTHHQSEAAAVAELVAALNQAAAEAQHLAHLVDHAHNIGACLADHGGPADD